MRLKAAREGHAIPPAAAREEGAGRAKKTRLAAASSGEAGGGPLAVLKSLVRQKKQALARNNPDATSIKKNLPITVKRNTGVEKRACNDANADRLRGGGRKDTTDEDERIQACLSAKAKIYDQLTGGDLALFGAGADECLLIDIEAKKKLDAQVKDISQHQGAPPSAAANYDLVEFLDTFGRTRLVTKGQLANLLATQREETVKEAASGGAPAGKWAWSKGVSSSSDELSEHNKVTAAALAIGRVVKQRIDEELAALDPSTTGPLTAINAPWEVVFSSSAKAFIEDVHVETERVREALGKRVVGNVAGDAFVFPEEQRLRAAAAAASDEKQDRLSHSYREA